MTTELSTPKFVQAAYEAKRQEELKAQQKEAAQYERRKGDMFRALENVLGKEQADEIIQGGEDCERDGKRFWRFGLYGFKGSHDYACEDDPTMFQFCVLEADCTPYRDGWWNTSTYSQVLGRIERYKSDKRAEEAAKQAAPKVQDSEEAAYFKRLMYRLNHGTETELDELMVAMMKFWTTQNSDQDPDYDYDDRNED